jgi:hypothetical protein
MVGMTIAASYGVAQTYLVCEIHAVIEGKTPVRRLAR